jgi:hypothetical protein
MDRVRFGRAPNPNPPKARATAGNQTGVSRGAEEVVRRVAEAHHVVNHAKGHAKKQAWSLGKSVWAPLKSFSSVLWLQVTGTFFAIFALFMGQGVWKLRGGFRAPASSQEAHTLYFHVLVFLVFAYFTVSNFVRASLRERRQRAG